MLNLISIAMELDREGLSKATPLPKRQSAQWCVNSECIDEWEIIEIWVLGKKVVTKAKRWYKDVGLGFKTPSEAIQGTYIGAQQFAFLKRLIAKILAWFTRQEVPLHW